MSEKKELSRSDQVRQRRESNTVKRVQRARKDATRPVPPVTSRTRQAVAAPKRKPAQNARRRYQVALTLRRRMPARSASAPSAGHPPAFLPGRRVAWRCNLSCVHPAGVPCDAGEGHRQPADLAEELSSAMSITGQPVFMLKPADLETRLRLNLP